MIYMYKTVRIHTFIHICCLHIYIYIYSRSSVTQHADNSTSKKYLVGFVSFTC